MNKSQEKALEIGLGFVQNPACVAIKLRGKTYDREKAESIIKSAVGGKEKP